jgi:hypothetical protein
MFTFVCMIVRWYNSLYMTREMWSDLLQNDMWNSVEYGTHFIRFSVKTNSTKTKNSTNLVLNTQFFTISLYFIANKIE